MDSDPQPGSSEGASAFLGKPFNDEALLEAVHSSDEAKNTKGVLLLR